MQIQTENDPSFQESATGGFSPRPAGFIRRAIASLLDTLIIVMLFQFFMVAGISALSLATGLSLASGSEVFDLSGFSVISLISLFFIQLGYFTFFHARCGQTPGKMILRIIVVTDPLSPLSPPQAFFRALGLFISASFFGFGFLITLFGRKKRALHDFLCGTQVVLAP